MEEEMEEEDRQVKRQRKDVQQSAMSSSLSLSTSSSSSSKDDVVEHMDHIQPRDKAYDPRTNSENATTPTIMPFTNVPLALQFYQDSS